VLTGVLVAQGIGFLATLVLLVAGGAPAPTSTALLWSGAAGLVGVIGLGAFYYALARGTMGLIAPLAGLIGAGVPVAVGMVAGEQIGASRLVGVAIGLLAVLFISLPGGRRSDAEQRALRLDLADLPIVVVAGLGFAGFFLFIDRALAEGADIWWALTAVRSVGLSTVLVAAAGLVLLAGAGARRRRVADLFGLAGLPRRALIGLLPLSLATGLGDLGGNGFFALARQADLLSVAVVLSSLYPVFTTLLAALLLHERMSRLQLGGVGLAVLAVVLISVR